VHWTTSFPRCGNARAGPARLSTDILTEAGEIETILGILGKGSEIEVRLPASDAPVPVRSDAPEPLRVG